MTFLESFLSEFRSFQRIPTVGQTKNSMGEIEKTEMLPETIVGILLKRKRSSFNQSQIEKEVNYTKSEYVFRYKKGVSLNRDDIIEDEFGSRYKVILKPERVIVFGGIFDHNMASLTLIE